MIREAALSESSVAAQIHAVSQAAYALEAEWIGCAQFPPLRETLSDLSQSSDRFLVFQQAGRIFGALAFDASSDPVAITRLVVCPSQLRQGIATALVTFLEQHLPPPASFRASTAQANRPAVLLYQRLGYLPATVTRSAEGLSLLHFTKSR